MFDFLRKKKQSNSNGPMGRCPKCGKPMSVWYQARCHECREKAYNKLKD